MVKAKYTGLHKLRHFFASWCINRKATADQELPLKVVQTRLGHASAQMTADLYGHLFPRGDDGAELAAERKRFSAKSSRRGRNNDGKRGLFAERRSISATTQSVAFCYVTRTSFIDYSPTQAPLCWRRFGEEELGRWKMLLRLRKEVIGGAQFSVDDVDARWRPIMWTDRKPEGSAPRFVGTMVA